ncbi:ThuA domain-containing protein [Marinicrinis lubricantis]|uniref:ThuA domain-containing protein n=1 Tax=Marinicrinis lubricantis TaxID=2086470 RepID=A0ABW1IUS5_9BACL
MKPKTKALFIGDNAQAPYHPLQPVRQEMLSILEEAFEVDATDEYGYFSLETLKRYELLISYTDRWNEALSSQQTADLLTYVSQGGGLLVIHNGISLQARPELSQLIGARFTGHPPYQELPFRVSAAEHEIMKGISAFDMDEEPYQFEFDPFTKRETLLEYELDGKKHPAAWVHPFGLGRVVFLMPGHHLHSFKHLEFRKLIVQGARFAANPSVG